MRNKNKKTKIVATLGPSINSKSKLKKVLDQGVNVLRINFSHATSQRCYKDDQFN
jgi:pyruvate kinase